MNVSEKRKDQMASKRKWRTLHWVDQEDSVSKILEKPKSFSSVAESIKRELNELETRDKSTPVVPSSTANLGISNVKPGLKMSSNHPRKKIRKTKATREKPVLLPFQPYNISPPLMNLTSEHQYSSRINTFSVSIGQPSITTFGFTESTDISSSANVGLAGVLLAMVSVLFIIFGIAFVFKFRNKYREEENEEDEQKKDPIEVWLNTIEPSFPPSAPLKKKVKNVVCSVHRKISGKTDPDKFIPGCPPHLRYQLKTLVVY